MSDKTRQIVFSARDDSVTALVSRLKGVTQDLDRVTRDSSRNQSESAKRNIKDYEDQIGLLEKTKRLQQENQSIANQRQPVNSTSSQDKDEKGSVFSPRDTEEDILKNSNELLRELIETNIRISQEQIINRTELHGSSSGGGSDDDNPFFPFPKNKPAKRGDGIGLSDIGGMLGGRMGGLSSMLKSAGPIGLALAAIAGGAGFVKSAYTNEMEREESLSKLSGVSGEGVRGINMYKDGGYFGRGGIGRRDRSSYGFSEDEFMNRAAPTAQNFGSASDINKKILDGMALERGTGMDSGLIGQMDRLSRITTGADNSTDITQSIYKAMSSTGAFGAGGYDLSRMDEIAQTFLKFQESNFMRAGSVNGGDAFLNMRSRLENTGESKFRRDDYAASTVESLNQGLYSEGTPEVQALKMDILRRRNPEMGFFELQAEQEKGLDSKGYLSGIMDMVKGTGGNIDQQAVLLNQMTGGQMRKSDILSLLKGDVNIDDLDTKAKGKSLDIEKRAENATSDLRDAIDGLKGEFSKFSQDFLTAGRMVPNQMGAIVQGLDAIKKLLQ